MSTLERISQIISEFKDLAPQDITNLINGLSNLRTAKIAKSSDFSVSSELPSLTVPYQLTPPFLEYVFIAFIKEVLKNYDSDYNYSDPSKITNNNSISVNSYYSDADMKDGQYPKVAIKCESMNFSSSYLGDMGHEGIVAVDQLTSKVHKNCWMQFSISIDVMSESDSEADILATILSTNLIQSMPSLREFAQLTQITFPSVMFAQKIREYDKVFLSKIQFSATKEVNWYELHKEESAKNLLISLVAVCGTKANCQGFEQMLLVSLKNSGDPELESYIEQIENNKEPRIC